jgi:hypothetical protein
MRALKRIFFLLVTTIAVIFLIAWSLDAFGFRSPISAFLINWLAMSWVAIVGQRISFSIVSKYYDTQPFEKTGKVYERLGIRLFKKMVRRGPLSVFSPTLRFPEKKTVAALRNLENEMRKAETGHLLIFIFMLLFAGYAWLNGWLDAVGWISLFNILFNVYPIMLQRYNRIKLQELASQSNQG